MSPWSCIYCAARVSHARCSPGEEGVPASAAERRIAAPVAAEREKAARIARTYAEETVSAPGDLSDEAFDCYTHAAYVIAAAIDAGGLFHATDMARVEAECPCSHCAAIRARGTESTKKREETTT